MLFVPSLWFQQLTQLLSKEGETTDEVTAGQRQRRFYEEYWLPVERLYGETSALKKLFVSFLGTVEETVVPVTPKRVTACSDNRSVALEQFLEEEEDGEDEEEVQILKKLKEKIREVQQKREDRLLIEDEGSGIYPRFYALLRRKVREGMSGADAAVAVASQLRRFATEESRKTMERAP